MNRSLTRARWAFLIAGVLCAHGAQAQLSSTSSRLFLRNTADGLPFAILGRLDPSVPGFGEAMAVGDFNCDGIEDLAIGAPDDAMASELIQAQAEARGLSLPDGAADYLVPRTTRSFAAIETLVATIDRISLERQSPATMSVWRAALEALHGPEQQRLL